MRWMARLASLVWSIISTRSSALSMKARLSSAAVLDGWKHIPRETAGTDMNSTS